MLMKSIKELSGNNASYYYTVKAVVRRKSLAGILSRSVHYSQ